MNNIKKTSKKHQDSGQIRPNQAKQAEQGIRKKQRNKKDKIQRAQTGICSWAGALGQMSLACSACSCSIPCLLHPLPVPYLRHPLPTPSLACFTPCLLHPALGCSIPCLLHPLLASENIAYARSWAKTLFNKNDHRSFRQAHKPQSMEGVGQHIPINSLLATLVCSNVCEGSVDAPQSLE